MGARYHPGQTAEMNPEESVWQRFSGMAADMGISLNPEDLSRCQSYLSAITAANQQFNLTAYRHLDELIAKVLLDSFSLLPVLAQVEDLSIDSLRRTRHQVLDVGAGAGIPGIPLRSIWPAMRLTLLESVRKKATFIASISDQLSLDAIVLCERAETLGQSDRHREHYDIVTARAVAALPTLCELTLPFARPGGLIVLPKGPQVQAELTEASQAIHILGGVVKGVYPANIPEEQAVRWIVVLRKVTQTPTKYPRRPGIPSKRPL